MSEHFQVAVIGAGPGGYVAALKAAQLGAQVAIIEKSHLGGTCLNWGCIPSKALLSSAELLHQIEHADDWGLKVAGKVTHDWKAIQGHKDKVITTLRGGIAALLKGRKVSHYSGTATLTGAGRIAVTDDKGKVSELTADKVILATGSQPIRIPGWPDDPALVCTSDESVHWQTLPRELLIVGGGVIGCEFACMMQPFGVKVTVVEMMEHLLPTLDKALGVALMKVFKDRGIDCHVATKVEEMTETKGVITVRLSNGQTLNFDRVLVATGRRPKTDGLGLDAAGIKVSDRGFVPVNDYLQTNVADHYAIGDMNGRCLLAHAASAHGVAAVVNALEHPRPFEAPIPGAVYTFPEIGSVGLTQQQCQAQDLPVSIGMFALSHLGKAMAARHNDGFVKVIRHRESDEILGCHMIGHNATECIAAAGVAMHQKMTTHELADAVFAHPTMSESIRESAEDGLGMGLHMPPRKVLRAVGV